MGLDKTIKSTTSKIVETLTQIIGLCALVITLVLVFDRAAVCSFYHIPVTYSSLDVVSVIPVIGKLYPVVIVIGRLGSWIYNLVIDSKEMVSDINWILNNKLTNKGSDKGRNIRKSKKNKRENGYGLRKWIQKLKTFYKHTHYDQELLGSSIGIKGVVIFGLMTIIILNVLNITIKAGNRVKFSLNFVTAILHCVLFLSLMVFFGKNFLISLKREYEETRKNIAIRFCDKNTENKESFSKSNQKETVPFLKTKLIFFSVTILMVLSTTITVYETVRLTMRNWYETVEFKDDEGINNQYIVALNLNDYYVLKRIVNEDNDLIIDTNEYIFKEKDNVRVSRKYYTNLCVGETINLDDIIEAINIIQAEQSFEGLSEQEQETMGLLNQLLETIEELLEEFRNFLN